MSSRSSASGRARPRRRRRARPRCGAPCASRPRRGAAGLGIGGVAGKTLAPTRARELEALVLDVERPASRDDDLPAAVSAICSAAPSMSASITANWPSPTCATSAVSASARRRRSATSRSTVSRAPWPRPAATRSSPSRPTCSTTTWSSLARARAVARRRCSSRSRRPGSSVTPSRPGSWRTARRSVPVVDGARDRVQSLAGALPPPRLADVQLARLAEQLGAGAVDGTGGRPR